MTSGHDSEVYGGTYRGLVEITADPEQRKRYRVRVTNIHPPEVEADHLPWAELGGIFGGGGFGDIPAFEVGDWVWVMFEGGDRRFPVIMGSVLNFDGGLPPLPAEQTAAYERTSKRWTRIDRAGNKIEMSPLEDELWVSIDTPDGSRIRVSAKDGTIELQASGRVMVVAPSVQIVDADSVVATTRILTADVLETATLRCQGTTNIRAADELNIGKYAVPGSIPPQDETTLVINIEAADEIKIESGALIDIDAAGEIQIDGQSKITVKSASDFRIESDAALEIVVQGDVTLDVEGALTATVQGNASLDIEGETTIDSALKITIECGAAIEVNAASQFTLTAGAAFSIEGDTTLRIEAGANLDISCGAILKLDATSQIELTAPIIKLTADSLAEMTSGGQARVDGAVVFIG